MAELKEGERIEVGDSIDLRSDFQEVRLIVELPFWVMIPDCEVPISVRGHSFPVCVSENHWEMSIKAVLDSKRSVQFIGLREGVPNELAQFLTQTGANPIWRKCRTVLVVESRCNVDAIAALSDDRPKRRNDTHWYFIALCSAHVQVLNALIQQYRLLTYDLFAHEVSPRDVPVWYVVHDAGMHRVPMLPDADFDFKLRIRPSLHADESEATEAQYASAEALQAASNILPSGG